MKAPRMDARKLDVRELPPTDHVTQALGISPSLPGLPSNAPATSTPPSNNGRICLAKPHVTPNHSPISPSLVLVMTESPMEAAAKDKTGWWGNRTASTMAGTAARTVFHQGIWNHTVRRMPKPSPKTAVIAHLALYRAYHSPASDSGLPQLAKTRMPTMEAKYAAVFHNGRPTSGSGRNAWAMAFSCSSLRKMRCISSPMRMLNTMAPTARAMPSCMPRTRAVRTMARTLIAGPEYRNVVAGPRPAPMRQMPLNRGSTVQEHTAKMLPETEATP